MTANLIEIYNPNSTNRLQIVEITDTVRWVGATPEMRVLAVALFHGHAAGTLSDCLRLAENAIPVLFSQGYVVATFT